VGKRTEENLPRQKKTSQEWDAFGSFLGSIEMQVFWRNVCFRTTICVILVKFYDN
jgi:hypothetical protein